MGKIGKFFFLFIFLSSLKVYAVVSVQSSVDRDRIGVGDEFVYTVRVISDGTVEISDLRPPDLSGFDLLETWEATSVSQKLAPGPSGMEFKSQRTKEFNYRLRAKAAGRRSLDSFEVTVDGKRMSTQPMALNITPQSQRGQQRQRNEEDEPAIPGFPGFPSMNDLDEMDRAQEELFRQLLQRRGLGQPRQAPQEKTMPINPNEAFFIQVEVDKTEVYEGEQVTASWYIYTRGEMQSLDRAKFPELKGFWKEIIEEAPSIQFIEEIVNGKSYKKALLASHALFPLKVGTAVIDEFKIKSKVRLPIGGGFGFAYGPPYEYTKSSKRVPIKVKPLPKEGRPSSFSGAVGQFEVSINADQLTVPAHQPMTLKIRFEGYGNAKGIELPAIEWPAGLEFYESKSDSKYFKDGRSYKQFDVLVIPRQEGELTIPPIKFSYFDPTTSRYVERTTEAFKLNVTPGTAPQNSASGSIKPLAQKSEAPATPQLPQLQLSFGSTSLLSDLFRIKWVWLIVYLIVFMILAFKARFELFVSDQQRDLLREIEQRYKKIKTSKLSIRDQGVEVINMISHVLGELTSQKGSSEQIDKMLQMIPPSLRQSYGQNLQERHQYFQTLAFAPDEFIQSAQMQNKLEQEKQTTKEILFQMIKQYNKAKSE